MKRRWWYFNLTLLATVRGDERLWTELVSSIFWQVTIWWSLVCVNRYNFSAQFPAHNECSNNKTGWSTMMMIAAAAARDDSSNVHTPPLRYPRRFHRSRKTRSLPQANPHRQATRTRSVPPPCTIAVESAPKSIPGTEPSSRRGADRRWAARRNEGNDPAGPSLRGCANAPCKRYTFNHLRVLSNLR